MQRRGTRRLADMLLSAVALLGASTIASPALAASGPVVPCPERSAVTFQALLDMRDQGGPLADDYPAMATNERGLECLGSTAFRFVAFRGKPEGLGGVIRSTIEPTWLDPWSGEWLAQTDAQEQGFSVAPMMLVAVDPGATEAFKGSLGKWVVVTATFDHPAATSCILHAAPEDEPFDPAEIVEVCRARLVVTGVSLVASAATPRPPSSPKPPAATPRPTSTPKQASPTPPAIPSPTPIPTATASVMVSAEPTPATESSQPSEASASERADPAVTPAATSDGGGAGPVAAAAVLGLIAVSGAGAALWVNRRDRRPWRRRQIR